MINMMVDPGCSALSAHGLVIVGSVIVNGVQRANDAVVIMGGQRGTDVSCLASRPEGGW